MNINFEKFTVSNNAAVDSLLAVANTALASAERINALNLNVARSAIEDSASAAKSVLGAKDAQAAVAAQQALVQPAIEKAVSYSKSLYEISAEAQQDLSKLVEAQFANFQAGFAQMIEQATAAAPAGSEGIVAALKDAIAQTNAAFNNASVVTKQFAEATQASIAAATKLKAAA